MARCLGVAKLPLGLARTLRDDVRAISGDVPMRWVSVRELDLRHPDVDDVIFYNAIEVAIAKGWMLGQGKPPHAVCLTDAGRRGAI